ncbi:hypothetical protein J6590_035538 [Homalodisca vitripennis]|nr:hypothetical protein J6590_035538 [Homalodisca vitripennis]
MSVHRRAAPCHALYVFLGLCDEIIRYLIDVLCDNVSDFKNYDFDADPTFVAAHLQEPEYKEDESVVEETLQLPSCTPRSR